MAEVRGGGSKTWRDELASIIDDTGIRYIADPITISTTMSFDTETTTTITEHYVSEESRNDKLEEAVVEAEESLKDQVKGFAMAWGEILMELGRGCRDIVQQSLLTEDSYIVRTLEKPIARVSTKLRYFNEFLPEDRDPAHAWPVVFFVFILALAGKTC